MKRHGARMMGAVKKHAKRAMAMAMPSIMGIMKKVRKIKIPKLAGMGRRRRARAPRRRC
jgi:hypothetical protein